MTWGQVHWESVGGQSPPARLQFGIGSDAGICWGPIPDSEITVRMRDVRSQRVDSQVLQYFGIDLVGCASTVWNSVLHSFNVRLEVLIFPSGVTGVTVPER